MGGSYGSSAYNGGVSMYRCICGAVFDEPLVITERNYDGDGHWEYLKMVLCPECQSPYFDEYEEEYTE